MLKRAISVGARFECQNATLLERVQSVLDYKEHSQITLNIVGKIDGFHHTDTESFKKKGSKITVDNRYSFVFRLNSAFFLSVLYMFMFSWICTGLISKTLQCYLKCQVL